MAAPFSRSLRALEARGSRSWLAWAVAAGVLLVAWTAWFLIARIPLYEISTRARVEAAAAAHPVDARVDGRVVGVHMSIGAPVRTGDVLVQLEADAERLALDEVRARLNALNSEVVSFGREIGAEERAIADDRRATVVARDEQRALIREAQAALDLADEEASRLARLRAKGIVPELEQTRAQSGAAARRATTEAVTAALTRIDHDQKTRESDRLVRIQRLHGTVSRLAGEAATAAATIKRLEYEVERRAIRAPIDGRVAEAAELHVGTVVEEGDGLAAIVPVGSLRIVAQLMPASAIGRVRQGQPARVRLLGFPWAEYGSLHASVTAVADEVRDGFVRVELAVATLPSSVPVSHGLPANVEIEVERVRPAWLVLRTLGGRLTQPVHKPQPAPGG